MTQYFLLFLLTFGSAIIANYLRFKYSDYFNRWILVLSSLLLVEIDGFLFHFIHTDWFVLVFIGLAVICFQKIGGAVSSIGSYLILSLQANEGYFLNLIFYLLYTAGVCLILSFIKKLRLDRERWLDNLLVNSKQLNIFKEVSFAMQQTLQLQKLLQTILTSVTAGYGLGFNRAMIFLSDEESNTLKGVMGTGPMTVEEGYATWERITKNRYKLLDLIEAKETEKSSDIGLNERVKRLQIPLDQPHFLAQALNSGSPLHIKEIDVKDEVLVQFAKQFGMRELAVVPLVYQGNHLGVLLIDNPVNKKPITSTALDSVIPLANQAAIAIQNTHLYAKIEDMALKDGLTGLYNQRAFQQFLNEKFKKIRISIILLDIDFFKHFNDTNGHMLGNHVLAQLAAVIHDSIREQDVAFRFGGEEFVILLPNTPLEQAAEVAERVRRNVESTPFPYGEKQPNGKVTISLGVASSETQENVNTDELVITADKALYRAKEQGKNKVCVAEGTKMS
jgi:diguanylate cyclase (GGDEF)-like protein